MEICQKKGGEVRGKGCEKGKRKERGQRTQFLLENEKNPKQPTLNKLIFKRIPNIVIYHNYGTKKREKNKKQTI